MRRAVLALLLVVLVRPASAHIGSPDVFFDGDAGPYRLFVAIRMPQVIPGVATIEVRSATPDITDLTVVPLRLTGPGSELPPTPDVAQRSSADPQFFTADLWLMERGSLKVRIVATGARGSGTLQVPVPAAALRTLAMDRKLGVLLFALMLVLALGLVAIATAAVREAALPPGEVASARAQRRSRLALVVAAVVTTGLLVAGNAWWNLEARGYEQLVLRPPVLQPHVEACALTIPGIEGELLEDHGHEMHLFLVRMPALDVLAHLHPARTSATGFEQALPSLPAGHYKLYSDVVFASGFPLTGTAELELPDERCDPPRDDDTTWGGSGVATRAELGDGTRMIWDRPRELHAGVAQPLAFRVENADGTPAVLEPYMMMAAHAEIVRTDGEVFAHIHPSGSVAMPALDLAQRGEMAMMPMHDMPIEDKPATPSAFAFPYGFPQAGDYRIFVQVKHAGRIVTGAFDAHVDR